MNLARAAVLARRPGLKPAHPVVGWGIFAFNKGFFTVNRACGQCQGTGQIISDPCTTCRGQKRVYKERTLSVTIPAGVETGMRLRLSHEGEHGNNGGPPGDLYIAISVKPHSHFIRKGNDILYDLKLPFVAAILGGKVEVPTLKGTTVVKIPEGTQHDKILRLKGLGAPDIKRKQSGDQLVRINIQLPTKLTPRQKELLTEFANEGGMSPDGQGEGIFDKVKNLFD